MQTPPDLEQIERWADGTDPLPTQELDALKRAAAAIGESRTAARIQAAADGRRVRRLLVVLYRAGWRNIAEMERATGVSRQTITDDLNEVGIRATTRASALQEADAA
jgi:hypothetical protein